MEKKKQKNKVLLAIWKFVVKEWMWAKPLFTTFTGVAGIIIAWCLVDGWPYVFIAVGTAKNIGWMLTVGLAAEAILWQPWMIEKPLVVFPLAVLIKKLLDKIFKKKKGVAYEPTENSDGRNQVSEGTGSFSKEVRLCQRKDRRIRAKNLGGEQTSQR